MNAGSGKAKPNGKDNAAELQELTIPGLRDILF